MKLILSQSDLFIKISKRLSLEEFNKLYKKILTEKYYSEFDPFCFLKAKNMFFKSLLNEYKKRKFISFQEYYLCIFFLVFNKSLLNLVFFFRAKIKLIKFKEINREVDNIYFDKNIDRVSINFLNASTLNVPFEKKIIQFTFLEKIKIVNLMIKYKFFSFWHVAQYFVLKKSKPNIKAKNLYVEEGGDFVGMMFSFLFRKNVNSVFFTSMAPTLHPAMKFCSDKVIVNNSIDYQKYEKIKVNLEFKNFSPIKDSKSYRSCKQSTVGYAPDIGNISINFHDKKILDNAILKNFAKNNTMQCFVSIHPQEKKINFSYYAGLFASSAFKIRTNESLIDYFSNIKVLITWYSTMIYQAIYLGVPVIVLDFFHDKHCDSLESISHGMVKIASSESQLQEQVIELINLPEKHLRYMHKECLRSIFNND